MLLEKHYIKNIHNIIHIKMLHTDIFNVTMQLDHWDVNFDT